MKINIEGGDLRVDKFKTCMNQLWPQELLKQLCWKIKGSENWKGEYLRPWKIFIGMAKILN